MDASRRARIGLICIVFIAVYFLGCSEVSFQEADPLSQRAKSGEYFSESYTQGLLGQKLDILFIVDNSNSMADEQRKLGERIDRFLATLHDIDWHLGITTTDVSNGTYGIKGSLLNFTGTQQKFISARDTDYSAKFLNTIVRPESYNCSPECASGDEQPLRAAIQAMDKRFTDNLGFFRPGADLGILVLSDEDEMSTGPSNATSPTEVLNYFTGIWGDEKKLYTYGMVVPPGDASCLNAQGGQGKYGSFVANLARLTGGLVGSICENDYAPTLGLLAEHARKLLDYVSLSYLPLEETLEIRFKPAHISAFRLEGRRVYFETPPPKGTDIYVGYMVK